MTDFWGNLYHRLIHLGPRTKAQLCPTLRRKYDAIIRHTISNAAGHLGFESVGKFRIDSRSVPDETSTTSRLKGSLFQSPIFFQIPRLVSPRARFFAEQRLGSSGPFVLAVSTFKRTPPTSNRFRCLPDAAEDDAFRPRAAQLRGI